MNPETQIELVRRAFAHIDAGTTDLAAEVTRNPVAAYTDPAWLAREKATLFRRYPLFMGLSGRIAEPGDYVAENLAGLPVLLVRGDDGSARAFVNQCRHRGAPVAKDCGRARGFRAPTTPGATTAPAAWWRSRTSAPFRASTAPTTA